MLIGLNVTAVSDVVSWQRSYGTPKHGVNYLFVVFAHFPRSSCARDFAVTVMSLSPSKRRAALIVAVLQAHHERKLRLRLAAIAAVVCVAELYSGDGRSSSIPRGVFSFGAILAGTTPRYFRRLYRMNHSAFLNLAEVLALTEGKKFRRTCPLMRLSATLRWLGGGSYLDIALAHGWAASTTFYVIHDTIRHLDKRLELKFPYQDEAWLLRVSQKFRRGAMSALSRCCGALDGLAVRIAEPSAGEVQNSSTYYNRKGFFALQVQAMCDSFYRITYLSCLCPGSSHDSTALAMSALYELLLKQEGGILEGYWVAGDDAYTCVGRLLTPWPGRNLSEARDCFNYWQSAARTHIEQAFGMIVMRWGILWRPLRCQLRRAPKIVSVCCKLHNYIIDSGDASGPPPPCTDDWGSHTEPADMTVHPQDLCDLDEALHRRRRDLEGSVLRQDFTDEIEATGRRRPRG